MVKNLVIAILVVALIGIVYYIRESNRYLIIAIIFLFLLLIALIQYLNSQAKKLSSKDTLPDTKYTYQK